MWFRVDRGVIDADPGGATREALPAMAVCCETRGQRKILSIRHTAKEGLRRHVIGRQGARVIGLRDADEQVT
jgi:hypothetical protein